MAYSQPIADYVCEQLALGRSLLSITRDPLEGMPAESTLRDWEKANPEFGADSTRAREYGCHRMAAECLEIANTPHPGEIITTNPDGTQFIKTEDMLGHRRLQIDTRMRLLGKWLPKIYGEKMAHGGAEDMPPIRTESTLIVTPEEAYKRMLGGG